jgi:serine/threonine-protein kinase RsbW
MQRRILIIDDHDDLATALQREFETAGHAVTVFHDRAAAIDAGVIEDHDVVITDLDVVGRYLPASTNGNGSSNGDRCLPHIDCQPAPDEHVKAFKICASKFRHDEFDEETLRSIVETTLNFKNRFVDITEAVQNMHESIEFELPSSISVMHSILDYLMKRVEKLGVIKSEQSNLFVALDEAFVNAVKHGNKFDTRKLVRVTADVTPEEARFTIEDQGEGFDVNSIPDPLDPANLFKPSGRGVLFIYNIMDEVKYNDRGNRLTMVKRSEEKKPEIVS